MGDSGSIRLLGPVEVSSNGHPIPVGGPIARLLLVQLALAGGRSVSDEHTIEAVWAQRPPDSVAAALRVHMTTLRAALRALGWSVDREHHGYALHADRVRLDVDDLTDAEAAQAESGDLSRALAATDRALALWRGPSLADVRRLPLGARLASGLDRRQEALVDRRLELLLMLGRTTEVLAPLDRLVHENPLNEARWALLATALYRAGHPAEALRTLKDARNALAEEAGLLPGPALRDLQQRILRHDVAPAHAQPSPPTARSSTGVPAALATQVPERLYGRDDELAALTVLLNTAGEVGHSVVVRVSGEPGAGKSALLAELGKAANLQGFQVLYGWAEKDAARPLGILDGPLTELLAQTPDLRDSQARRLLGGVLGWPDAEPVSQHGSGGLGPHSSALPVNERARVFEAVRRTLTASDEPLLLLLDDLHWADELSCAVIRSLARFPLPRRLVLVAAERVGRPSTIGGRGVTEVVAGALDAADLATWVQRPDGDAWTLELLSITGGLPLLVEEVLRQLRGGSELLELRASISRHLLRDRTAGLPTRVADVLLVAAILGQSFSFGHIRAVTAADELDLIEDLDAAAAAGILSYDVSDPGVFRFTHDLLRLAMLEGVTPLRRMRLHAQVLDRCEDLPALLAAHHAQSAGQFVDPARLTELTLRAATELLDSFGFDNARRMILEVYTAQMAPGARASMLGLLARAEAALGLATEARGHLEEALAAAQVAADPEATAQAVLLLDGLFGHGEAMAPDTPVRLEQLLDALPATATDTRFMLLRQLIFAHVSAGRLETARALLARTWPLAQQLGTPDAESALLHLEHFRSECAGEPRSHIVARAGELAVQGGGQLKGRFLGTALIEHLHVGDPQRADRNADQLIELGSARGEPYSEWLGLAAKFTAPFLAGDLATARRAAEHAFARGKQSELFGVDSAYVGQLFALGWVRGDLADFIRPTEAPDLEGPELAWRAARALVLALANHPDPGLAELTGLAGSIPTVGSQWIGFVGLALAVEAAVLLDHSQVLLAAEPILRRRVADHVILGTGLLDVGPVSRYLALTLAGTGRREEARALLAGVHTDDGAGAIWQLRAHYDLAALGRPAEQMAARAAAAAESGAWTWLSGPSDLLS